METKLIATILGVALVLATAATAATAYTQPVFAGTTGSGGVLSSGTILE